MSLLHSLLLDLESENVLQEHMVVLSPPSFVQYSAILRSRAILNSEIVWKIECFLYFLF